ncbi:MAG: hypothetical protein QG608_3671 [Actinomycetota bacterium]|nr:hypothetical protein [Actinomycetota bacterium]
MGETAPGRTRAETGFGSATGTTPTASGPKPAPVTGPGLGAGVVLRFFVGPVLGPVLVVGLSAFLCHSLTAWLGRLYEQPADMVELAGDQFRQIILVAAVGAGTSAFVASRHHRRGGWDLWRTAGVPQTRLALVQALACAVPILAVWGTFLVVTGVREGTGERIPAALPALLGSFAVVAAPCALGAFVGTCVPGRLAVPVAVGVVYVSVLVVVGLGDDTWWGWLAPAMDDSLGGRVRPLWVVGRALWFSGFFLAMVVLTAWVCERSRSWPRGLCPGLAGILLLAGAACLASNGASAVEGRPPASEDSVFDDSEFDDSDGLLDEPDGVSDDSVPNGEEPGSELWPTELRSPSSENAQP